MASNRITQQELESYLWGAAVLLRGLIDAGDYKQFIFPLLFYKRVADVWEEEYQAAVATTDGDLSYAKFSENHRFQIPDGAHWNDVRHTPKNVGAAIQRAMRAIESANPDMLDGIFGDAPWTNRERLPDATLKNLIEHFSTQTLSVASVPEDELGNAYEYLIKKFADDSGHTAAEFYTNRTVVHLMTQLLNPQPGESIYDPTCGTGGMLISALDEVKRSGGEYRTLKLYGQEHNLITSSIARMNLFLHGVEDFAVIRGDTLADPRHSEGDRLRQLMSSWPTRLILLNSGIARRGRKTNGVAISSARRRRAELTMRFSSTFWLASPPKGAARCCGRTACCSATKSRPCAPRWLSRTGSRPSLAWGQTCSTTLRWSLAWWSATVKSPRSAKERSSSLTQ